MAKGIESFGTLSGKLGEKVYYRSGGEQRSRIRVRSIKNPKTNAQIYQRARFLCASTFYTHGREKFFDFAFEDKKQNESYFNAFMRNNVQTSWPVSKTMKENPEFPYYNYWMMTKGSLQPIQCRATSSASGEYITGSIPVNSGITEPTTMAELTRILIDTGNYEDGDIITFLTIWSATIDITDKYPLVNGSYSGNNFWNIFQFNLSLADTNTLAYYGLSVGYTSGENVISLSASGVSQMVVTNKFPFGGCVIHSRKTSAGTKVSTQYLVLGDRISDALGEVTGISQFGTNQSISAEYVNAVISNWRDEQTINLQPEAILQGANSVNFDFEEEPANPA